MEDLLSTSYGFKNTLQKYHIKHKMTTPYHPQANGQVESTNKVIEAILTKTMNGEVEGTGSNRFP